MRRVTRDFITLFNKFWYRDFPLAETHKDTGSRAEWTTHIGICRDARDSAQFSAFISYSRHDQHDKNLAAIRNQWGKDDYPLLVILATYAYRSRARWLDELQTYHLQRGRLRKVRSQPANPWKVPGSRWQSIRSG